jgi:hypothetical protein
MYGPARLATVNAALNYVDSIILNDGRVDVEFNQSLNNGSGTPLASAGSFYPTSPTGSNRAEHSNISSRGSTQGLPCPTSR